MSDPRNAFDLAEYARTGARSAAGLHRLYDDLRERVRWSTTAELVQSGVGVSEAEVAGATTARHVRTLAAIYRDLAQALGDFIAEVDRIERGRKLAARQAAARR